MLGKTMSTHMRPKEAAALRCSGWLNSVKITSNGLAVRCLGSAAWLEERTAGGMVSQKLNLALDPTALPRRP